MRITFFCGKHLVDVPDHAELRGSDGRIYEIVRPRWWRIDRWISWLLTPAEQRGVVSVVAFGGRVDVRVREVAS